MPAAITSAPTEGGVDAPYQAFRRFCGTQSFRQSSQPCSDHGDIRIGLGVMIITKGLERLFVIFVLGFGERFALFTITEWAAAVLWLPHADSGVIPATIPI